MSTLVTGHLKCQLQCRCVIVNCHQEVFIVGQLRCVQHICYLVRVVLLWKPQVHYFKIGILHTPRAICAGFSKNVDSKILLHSQTLLVKFMCMKTRPELFEFMNDFHRQFSWCNHQQELLNVCLHHNYRTCTCNRSSSTIYNHVNDLTWSTIISKPYIFHTSPREKPYPTNLYSINELADRSWGKFYDGE